MVLLLSQQALPLIWSTCTQVFAHTKLMVENIYLKEMISLPPGEAISFDHTFRVAANIVFLTDDGTWVARYDSVFIVVNKDDVLTSNSSKEPN